MTVFENKIQQIHALGVSITSQPIFDVIVGSDIGTGLDLFNNERTQRRSRADPSRHLQALTKQCHICWVTEVGRVNDRRSEWISRVDPEVAMTKRALKGHLDLDGIRS